MVICLCHGLNEKQIRELVREGQIEGGQVSLEQVQAKCGAGTDCGACVKKLKALVGAKDDQGHQPA